MNKFKRAVAVLLIAVLVIVPFSGTQAAAAGGSGAAKTILIPLDQTSLDWLRTDDTNAIRLINQLLEEGVEVKWALEEFSVDNVTYPAGTFYVEAPFTTDSGISGEAAAAWLQWEAKQNGVYSVRTTGSAVTAASKTLVMPRILLFYDTTTYENCLRHYEVMSKFGFKVQLVSAAEIIATDWNDPESVFANANVFCMPGGALHFWAFPDEESQAKGIENIRAFVESGGGYIGVCAGSSEALAQSPYPYLSLVDANYHSEWFVYDDPAQGDWDWRQLIGPVYLEIEESDHPVMFGYGGDAVRPGYGDLTTMYYYGGPAMWNMGAGAATLATYASPVTQRTTEKVADIWGAAAVVAQDFGAGKAVLFGPHPEWPGPCSRMYAQALYYAASMEKDSFVDIRIRENAGSAGITSERVAAITSTVRSSKPLLERITRSASEIVNLRVGDHYHPLGVWYDESIMAYGQAVYDQLNKIQSYAVKFQFEYARLKQLKRSLAADDPLQGRLDFAMAAIEAFYSACEEFTLDGHLISDADWTGTVYAPFADYEAGTFSELTRVFAYIADEMETTTVPFAKGYKAEFDAYEAARINWENDPTEDNKAAVDALYVKLSSSWPADQLYIGMYIMRHVLDIMQFKVDGYLLDIMTIADRAEEVVSLTNYAAADEIGAVGYAADTASAFLAYPVGGVLK